MTYQDAFVGMVAIGLGVGGIAAAINNWESCYRVGKVRWIESVGGRSAARVAYGLLGIGLIALGLAIACGFAPNKSEARKFRPSLAADQP